MLRDSVQRYRPGIELHDAACMAILKDSIGFADALVSTHSGYNAAAPEREYRIIKLVEPQDRARVQWDTRRREQYWSIRPSYAALFAGVTDSTGYVQTERIFGWLQFGDSASRAAALARAPARFRADGERVYGFLDAHRGEADLLLAMRVLDRDGFAINRVAAVAVLRNFRDRDSTWHALVRALRDPDERVRAASQMVMNGLPQRSIDWAPVSRDLRLLLGGTNINAIDQVMMLLASTGVKPSLARPLLRGNAHLVIEHLGSDILSGWALQLLRQLSGGARYTTKAEWRAWAAKL